MKKKEIIDSFLGKDARFDGNLTFRGTVRIDGHFKGDISASGNLIVGEKGKIEADIRASSVISNGEIHGSIVADQSLEIRAPGKVYGDIQAPTVVIQEGVLFEGNCWTLKEEADLKRPVAIRPIKSE